MLATEVIPADFPTRLTVVLPPVAAHLAVDSAATATEVDSAVLAPLACAMLSSAESAIVVAVAVSVMVVS